MHDKRDWKVVAGAFAILIVLIALVLLIKNQSETSAHQRMLNEKEALLMEYLTPEWHCISKEGGWNEQHQMYEYTFTFMVRGNSSHVIYAYADQRDLTRDTVSLLERVEENGFEYTKKG